MNPTRTKIPSLGHGGLVLGIQLSDLGTVPFVLALRVKSQGVILDASLSMSAQVTTAAR